jgi:serine phosphatase RsbU (regulator of sigma subunit)
VCRSRGQVLFETMPFMIMGVVAVAVVLVHRAADALPLLSLGPASAALAGELLYLLVAGGAALAVCAVLDVYRHLVTSAPSVLAFTAIAAVTAAGVVVSAGIRRRRQELAQLAAIAEVTQRVLLRPVPEEVGPVRMAVRYVSASRGARVGGDLYETARTWAGLRFMIGDVQGKGLGAVQTAAVVLGAFRESAYDAASLEVIADRIEQSLIRQENNERFVTGILAQLSPDGSKIELLNRGHPPPLLFSEGGARFVDPAPATVPFGLADLGGGHGEPMTIALGPGDRLLFYTDGISEARGGSGEFFSLTDSLAVTETPDPGAALAALSDEVLRHVGHPLADDAAMLLLCR